MTRATEKALKRIVSGQSHGELVLEITREEIRIRPLGCRRGAVSIPHGAVYLRAVQAQVEAEHRQRVKRKKRVRRGRRIA